MAQSHKKNTYTYLLNNIGKNPELDWVSVVIVFFGLFLGVVALSIGLFFQITYFITHQLEDAHTPQISNTKTKEEELRELVNVYQVRKEKHQALLGTSDIRVEQIVSTSTESVATTTSATSTPVAPASVVPAAVPVTSVSPASIAPVVSATSTRVSNPSSSPVKKVDVSSEIQKPKTASASTTPTQQAIE
jgi:hypothetical protein